MAGQSRRLLLATDRHDRSTELASILASAGEVTTIPTADLPDTPPAGVAGVIVDIDLRSVDSVGRLRTRLTSTTYRMLPRLFVLSDAMHHGTTQAWALGATDTIQRPFDAAAILARIRAAFPDAEDRDPASTGETLAKGISAAHKSLVALFGRLATGQTFSFDELQKAEKPILKALKRSSLRDWLLAVSRHHNVTYRHTLAVTGYATAFAIHLNMREDDQRRIIRATLAHDIGKAFIPVAILDKRTPLDADEDAKLRAHARLGYDALMRQGGFPREVLEVALHHHERLDGSGYPDRLAGNQISDMVRIIGMIDTYVDLVEERGKTSDFTRARAFAIMEDMGGALDQALVQAFRPVALGG